MTDLEEICIVDIIYKVFTEGAYRVVDKSFPILDIACCYSY